MFSFDSLLFIVLVTCFPIFVYHNFLYSNKDNRTHLPLKSSIILGVICSISILITMANPFQLASGYFFDLRHTPWLISLLYGGIPAGTISTIVLIAYRFEIGGTGAWISFISIFSAYMFAIGILTYYRSGKLIRKLTLVSLIQMYVVSTSLIGVLITMESYNITEILWFFAYFAAITLTILLFNVYLIHVLEEKEHLRSEAQQLKQQQLIGQLAASVAHEIRNPLTSINGFVQLLQKDTPWNEKQLHYLQQIQQDIQQAEKTISSYLTFAEPHIERLENINLREKLSLIRDVIQPIAQQKGVEIDFDCKADLIIKGNKEKVFALFYHLVENALEASDSGTTVSISCKSESNQAIIHIIDSGVGMDEEELQKIGTPFYSTKMNGVGLGLAISHRIVSTLGGTTSIHSTKGQGTNVIVSLPLYVA